MQKQEGCGNELGEKGREYDFELMLVARYA